MKGYQAQSGGAAQAANAQARAREADGKRLRNLAANMIFGLALLDDKLRILKHNGKFRSFFEGLTGVGAPICDAMRRDCAVPDGCETCPIVRCLKTGLNYEREFARHLSSDQEQHLRLVASSARLAPPRRQTGEEKNVTAEAPDGSAEPVTSSPADSRQEPASRSGLTLILIEDVTRKRLIEQKLLRAQRLEAMSTLAGGIAHEINQPLSALNLYASGLQILLEKEELPPLKVLRERVGLILEQSRKISEITQHMRFMAIQSATVYEEVDVPAVLRDALKPLEGKLAQEKIELQLCDGGQIPHVKAIAVQLSQVVGNLVGNAIEALRQTEEGGGRRIRVSAGQRGNRVVIEVADSGPGIPSGQERRIFDPFFTTKGPSGGMGLGLSITHAFVRSWGGEVQVRARHPELGGASFGVLLHLYGMDAHPLAGS